MKQIIPCFFTFGFLIISLNSLSQTFISDKQEIFGVWTKQNSPYIINGEAIIPSGKTLKIEAGTIIQFRTDDNEESSSVKISDPKSILSYLRIKGQILAEGTANEKIIFTRLGDTKHWGIILFDRQSDTSRMSYCKIEYADELNPCLNDTDIEYNQASGAISFQLVKNPVLIEYCEITKCDNGIDCIYSKNIKVEYCIIHNNKTLGIYNGYNSELSVNHCTLYNNQFSAYNSKTEIRNTIIWTAKNKKGFYANPGIFCENCIIKGYSDLYNSCFSKNPKFVKAKKADFRLKKNSPCRKKGVNKSNGYIKNEETDIGAIKFVND